MKFALSRTTAVGAVTVMALAGGGYALASSVGPASTTTYSGCIETSTRYLENVHTGTATTCPKGNTKVTWNQRGPRGLTGARGPAGPIGPQGPAGRGFLPYRPEVDNGTEFAVSQSASLADTSSTSPTYSDSGIVVDDGLASNLTSVDFAVSATGGNVSQNVWIGNGPQAATAGIYPLSSTDFCYGLGTDYTNGVPADFQMQSQCGSYANHTLTIAQVAADFPGLEAYTWAGVTNNGSSTVGPVSISAVGSQSGLTAAVGIVANADGSLTPYVNNTGTSPAVAHHASHR